MRALTLAAILLATPAAAQNRAACGDVHALGKMLAQNYGEHRIVTAINGDGSLTIVFATPSGSTWSIVKATPSGPACLVAEGTSWEAVTPPQPGAPA